MMDFKRSLRGYSEEQVLQFLNERSVSFQARRQELESDLEAISQSEQALAQLLNKLQIQHDQARQRHQIIESSKPVVDIFLNLCQDYVANQAEIFMKNNESLLAEITLQTEQINADQNKLQLFWQTLHANLGNLLNAVEVAESAGKSLLSKYASDLNTTTMNINRSEAQPEPLPAADRFKVSLLETQSDFDRSETVQVNPLLATDRLSIAQRAFSADVDRFSVNLHDTPSVLEVFKLTVEDRPPVNEDTVQEETENNSLLLEKVSNVMESEQQIPQTTVTGSKHQALIMDDDATILAMLKIILERDGFNIIEYNDGYQASQNIDRIAPPLLAILENNSLNVSGLEMVRKIRSKPNWNNSSVIMLTENASELEIADLLEAGANAYINKPVNTREFVSLIRSLTDVSAAAL